MKTQYRYLIAGVGVITFAAGAWLICRSKNPDAPITHTPVPVVEDIIVPEDDHSDDTNDSPTDNHDIQNIRLVPKSPYFRQSYPNVQGSDF